MVVSSYINHALILGDDVFVSWPLYMQRYKLDGSSDKVGWPAGDLLNEALTGMSPSTGEKSTADGRGLEGLLLGAARRVRLG